MAKLDAENVRTICRKYAGTGQICGRRILKTFGIHSNSAQNMRNSFFGQKNEICTKHAKYAQTLCSSYPPPQQGYNWAWVCATHDPERGNYSQKQISGEGLLVGPECLLGASRKERSEGGGHFGWCRGAGQKSWPGLCDQTGRPLPRGGM